MSDLSKMGKALNSGVRTSVLLLGPLKSLIFLANKKLVEYEIQMVALFTTSEQNISRAMARVVFRRRMEFHVTNTFLQTFTLVCVGYLSLYFDVDNFTDRIMVTLTTMLVIATVSSSVSSVIFAIFCIVSSASTNFSRTCPKRLITKWSTIGWASP